MTLSQPWDGLVEHELRSLQRFLRPKSAASSSSSASSSDAPGLPERLAERLRAMVQAVVHGNKTCHDLGWAAAFSRSQCKPNCVPGSGGLVISDLHDRLITALGRTLGYDSLMFDAARTLTSDP